MKQICKITALAASYWLLSACTADYQIIRNQNVAMPTSDRYYVATPENGQYGGKVYAHSGTMTRDILFSGLSMRGIAATRGEASTKQAALIDAKQQQCNRVIYPTILHWEDRMTEWSGIRDKVKVAVDILDAGTGETLDYTLMDLTGTWWTSGGLHPQDLIEEASEDYFDKVFGR